jgi:hypothetical protein
MLKVKGEIGTGPKNSPGVYLLVKKGMVRLMASVLES